MNDIDRQMGRYVELMEIKDRQILSPSEAEYRASVFLTACAHCTNLRMTYSELLNGAKARAAVAYKIALLDAKGKNVPQCEAIAEADPEYLREITNVGNYEAGVKYFEQYYQTFNNTHIMYRNYNKEMR
jgi:hypothetical protein